ncbi:hypothetical protein [Clostridium luticellarii]|jgi:hypothetical protein|uniref:hypothetical protein n=1 Tax=Clostridium luticellarii TaxID=1691940 RepID=UPI000D03AB28|nr:hypothetical protein [Clostridium luticellarii]
MTVVSSGSSAAGTQGIQKILEFTTEYQLTDEPLRIDVLVVKKLKEIEIHKSLERIFKKYNILEYQVILRFRWSFLIRNTYLHMNLRRTYPGA